MRAFLLTAYAATLVLRAADPESAVRLLSQKCQQCHGEQVQMAGIRLGNSEEVLKHQAKIEAALAYSGKVKMPPTGKLADAEQALLTDWMKAGAKWADTAKSPVQSTWWSFQAPKRPAVPAIQSSWARNDIDRFVLAKLNKAGYTPAPEADRATLIRRVKYLLHGLPPTYEEVQAFANDKDPQAYEKLIDKLLASPRYGEKWGKHWLDLVRYGDTSGFEQDPYLLYAWRYRDYVIKAFNDDKPYDEFIKEQIAGDEIYPEEPERQQGTGYFTVGTNRDMLYKVEDINKEEQLTDFVDTTSSVFLGLTAGCARCHDHKFDPIPQRDYFRMRAIFAPLVKSQVFLHYNNARGYNLGENTRTFRLYEIGAQLSALMDPHRKKIRDARLEKLGPEVVAAFATADEKRTPQQKVLTEMHQRSVEPSDDEVIALFSKDELERLHKIERRLVSTFKNYGPGPMSPGAIDYSREAPKIFLPNTTEEMKPAFFSALGGGAVPEAPLTAETSYRRKALAEWIARADNPLTSRVMANRVWQYLMGRGLLSTASDFGTRAGEPSHPELLDWLAVELPARKWSLKSLQREILLSATFRQSTKATLQALEKDPENSLLSHFNRRRLEAEEIRDSVLQSAQTLNLKMYGRPVVPTLETEELYGMSQPLGNAWIVTEDKSEHTRRSIYMISRRNFRMPLLEAFDRPEGVLSCSRRDSSTTAPQSLSLLNGAFTLQQSQALAAKLVNDEDPIRAAWRSAYARDPRPSEQSAAQAFLQKQANHFPTKEAGLTELARGLFNTNEFLYVD